MATGPATKIEAQVGMQVRFLRQKQVLLGYVIGVSRLHDHNIHLVTVRLDDSNEQTVIQEKDILE